MFQDFDNLEFQQDIMGVVYLCSTMSGVLVGKTESLGMTCQLGAVLSLLCLAVDAGFWLNPSMCTLHVG